MWAAILFAALLGVWLGVETALDFFDPAGMTDDGDLPEKLRTWNLRLHSNLFGNYDIAPSVRLRGEAWPVAKPAGETRVLCLGSSSTYGAGLPPEDAYPALLAARLGAGYRVGNAGWGGYNSFQLSIYLRHVLLRLQPDFVVFYYGGNERFGADTVAYWRHATHLLAGYLAPTPDHAEMALRYGTTSPAVMGIIDRLHGLRLYGLLRDRLIAGRRQARFVAQPADALDSAAVLSEMVGAVTRTGAQMILVPEIAVERGIANEKYAALMAKRAVRREDVEYLNVADRLLDPANFIDTVHLNRDGAALLAGLIAQAITGAASPLPLASTTVRSYGPAP